jgi:hypothetical protein
MSFDADAAETRLEEIRRSTLETLEDALKRAEWFNRPPQPFEVPNTRGLVGALEIMGRLDEISKIAAKARDELLVISRAEGASWRQIGDELGLTRQAAHARWRGVDETIPRQLFED